MGDADLPSSRQGGLTDRAGALEIGGQIAVLSRGKQRADRGTITPGCVRLRSRDRGGKPGRTHARICNRRRPTKRAGAIRTKLYSNRQYESPQVSHGIRRFCRPRAACATGTYREQQPGVTYAIAVDQRGYVPTHNACFSKPLTGSYDKDLVGNRTKRIFDDATGRRGGAHTDKVLVQTYWRNTGEVMHDLSVPIYVKSRHRGGFRMGYKADE